MLNKEYRRILVFLFFNCLAVLFLSLELSAQEMEKPFRNDFLLSGNFGELRSNHLHAGIDIRTEGVEGWPVICVKDGTLVRVSVSPTGYGQALYVEHPDGTTTVYGHLQRFIPSIAHVVRELQYCQESFQIDENMKCYRLHFKKGDTIAYSGNSGSSGGPHLHFEIRNTQTEHTWNPLHFYSIKDNKAPVVRKIYLYTIAENGYVDCLGEYALKKQASGNYDAGVIHVAADSIGIGVYVTDYMNDSWNKLGVYQMNLLVEQDTLFSLQMDSCSFHQSVFIHDLKDFACYRKKETVYRCFGNYQNQILGIKNKENGSISVSEGQLVHVQLHIADINGNQTQVQLKLKGGKKTLKTAKEVLNYEQTHLLELPGCRVKLDSGSLFASVKKDLKIEWDSVNKREIFILSAEEVPLLKKGYMYISGNYSPRSVICEIDSRGKKRPIATNWCSNALEARIAYLGRYTVVEDTVAPEVVFLGKFPNRTLHFKMVDDFSGIASYRGEVNGKWCLFAYDAKTDLLQCNLSEPVFEKKRENEVKIIVVDKVGNKKELLVQVVN